MLSIRSKFCPILVVAKDTLSNTFATSSMASQQHSSLAAHSNGDSAGGDARCKTTNMPQVFDLNIDNSSVLNEHVMSAKDALLTNKVIAVPTDTIYGFASLANSDIAVEDIYSIKGRDFHKVLSICVGDVVDVKRCCDVSICEELLSSLLPGPVTLIFNRLSTLNPAFNPHCTSVGIRVPDYKFIRDVARACDQPLALTSANYNGEPSSLQIHEFRNLWPRLSCVFDGGVLGLTETSRLGSTVVDLSHPGTFTIVRPGSACDSTTSLLLKYGLTQNSKNS